MAEAKEVERAFEDLEEIGEVEWRATTLGRILRFAAAFAGVLAIGLAIGFYLGWARESASPIGALRVIAPNFQTLHEAEDYTVFWVERETRLGRLGDELGWNRNQRRLARRAIEANREHFEAVRIGYRHWPEDKRVLELALIQLHHRLEATYCRQFKLRCVPGVPPDRLHFLEGARGGRSQGEFRSAPIPKPARPSGKLRMAFFLLARPVRDPSR